MGKQKTKKAWAKRFKKKKSGVIIRRKAGKTHLQTSKRRKRKRRLRQPAKVSKADSKRIKGFI